ncbi:MAG: hypothetical protein VX929_00005 [Pseudomonadota bacterium]|nr:hypothetical protein [Pseudomonadota bacterium]
MNTTLLRTFQAGVALLVFTIAMMAILVLLGILDSDQALRIGINISAVIGICLVAGLGLTALFGLRSGKSEDQ